MSIVVVASSALVVVGQHLRETRQLRLTGRDAVPERRPTEVGLEQENAASARAAAVARFSATVVFPSPLRVDVTITESIFRVTLK